MIFRKFLKFLSVFVFCATALVSVTYGANNVPYGDIGESGNWITRDNMAKFNSQISNDVTQFQKTFSANVDSDNFVPIEVKIGLVFMKALSAIDSVLQISLVRFTILFLLVMYAFWVGLEAYRMIHESSDYKQVFYDIFIRAIKIAAWIIVLHYGVANIFTIIMNPIITAGMALSDFILNAVAQTYQINLPDTCGAIHQYVNANTTDKLLIDPDSAANIMCLPARLSVYFYHGTANAFEWIINGFGHSLTMVVVGIVCVVLFIKCIFKYAFMTLGIVADLFLTLLMLPFTAIAECMPSTKETNYAAQIFSGLLKLFNTQNLSAIILKFINAAIYFVSLSIIIAISAVLLTNIISIDTNNTYFVGSTITSIMCACLILYLAGKTEDFIKQIGGSIDNSFGTKLENDTKTLWNNIKGMGSKIFDAWLKKK